MRSVSSSEWRQMPSAWPSSWVVVSARQGPRLGALGSERGSMNTRTGRRSWVWSSLMSRSVAPEHSGARALWSRARENWVPGAPRRG